MTRVKLVMIVSLSLGLPVLNAANAADGAIGAWQPGACLELADSPEAADSTDVPTAQA